MRCPEEDTGPKRCCHGHVFRTLDKPWWRGLASPFDSQGGQRTANCAYVCFETQELKEVDWKYIPLVSYDVLNFPRPSTVVGILATRDVKDEELFTDYNWVATESEVDE